MTSAKENARGEAGVHVVGEQAEATLKKSELDYAPLGNLVQANLTGQSLASTVLEGLQTHYGDPDSLYLALKSIMPESRDIEALTAIRGFMRRIQKALERSAPISGEG